MHSLFISSLFFSFVLKTSGIKAKCFNKQEKRRLVSLYQINREQNCLTKLHLRQKRHKKVPEQIQEAETKELSLPSHCIRGEVNQFAQWFMAKKHEARSCPLSKKINFGWKWRNWAIFSVGKFSIPHALCFNLSPRQLPWDFFKCYIFSPSWSRPICSEDVSYHAGRRIEDNQHFTC